MLVIHSVTKSVKSAFSSSHQAKMGHLPGLLDCLLCPRQSHFSSGLSLLPCFLVYSWLAPSTTRNFSLRPAPLPQVCLSWMLHILYSFIIHALRTLLAFSLFIVLNSLKFIEYLFDAIHWIRLWYLTLWIRRMTFRKLCVQNGEVINDRRNLNAYLLTLNSVLFLFSTAPLPSRHAKMLRNTDNVSCKASLGHAWVCATGPHPSSHSGDCWEQCGADVPQVPFSQSS